MITVMKKMKAGKYILMVILSVCLCACASKEESQTQGTGEPEEKTEIFSAEETDETVPSEEPLEESVEEPSGSEGADTESGQTEDAGFDVHKVLEDAEEASGALEKKLFEDPSLNQAEMNTLSYEMYVVWDDVLNELWQVLKDTLAEEEMEKLLEEQRTWIADKEEEVKKAAEGAGGGSLASLVANQRAAELTKTRVYELAAYLGYAGESQ